MFNGREDNKSPALYRTVFTGRIAWPVLGVRLISPMLPGNLGLCMQVQGMQGREDNMSQAQLDSID